MLLTNDLHSDGIFSQVRSRGYIKYINYYLNPPPKKKKIVSNYRGKKVEKEQKIKDYSLVRKVFSNFWNWHQKKQIIRMLITHFCPL